MLISELRRVASGATAYDRDAAMRAVETLRRTPGALVAVVELVVVPSRLPRAVVQQLIRLCMVGGRVPGRVVLRVLLALRSDKLAAARSVQVALARWATAAVVWLDTTPAERLAIALLAFHKLNIGYLAPHMAAVVFATAPPLFVRPWRVQWLAELAERFPADEHMAALRLAFHVVRPHDVPDPGRWVGQRVLAPDRRMLAAWGERAGSAVPPNSDVLERNAEFDKMMRWRQHHTGSAVDGPFGAREVAAALTAGSAAPNMAAIAAVLGDAPPASYVWLHYALASTPRDREAFAAWAVLAVSTAASAADFRKVAGRVLQALAASGGAVDVAAFRTVQPPAGAERWWWGAVAAVAGWWAPGAVDTWLQHLDGERDAYRRFASVLQWLTVLAQWVGRDSECVGRILVQLHDHSLRWLSPGCERRCGEYLVPLAVFSFVERHADQLPSTAVVPPAPLVYLMLVLAHPAVVNGVCGLLAAAKQHTQRDVPQRVLFNLYIMDACNLLWRNRAYEQVAGSAARGLMLPPVVVEQVARSVDQHRVEFRRTGDPSHHPAFAGMVAREVRQMEGDGPHHVGPLTPESVADMGVWIGGLEDVRARVLRRMGEHGMEGLARLLFSSLRSLLNRASGEGLA